MLLRICANQGAREYRQPAILRKLELRTRQTNAGNASHRCTLSFLASIWFRLDAVSQNYAVLELLDAARLARLAVVLICKSVVGLSGARFRENPSELAGLQLVPEVVEDVVGGNFN